VQLSVQRKGKTQSGPSWAGADEFQRKMSLAGNFLWAEFDRNKIVGCRKIPFEFNQSF
jgi:hypothetical protein